MSKVKVTRSRDISTDKNAINRQCVVISASNLVGIINMGVDACGILSRPVGEINRKLKCGGHSAYKMLKSTEHVAKSPKFCTLTGKSGSMNRTALSKFTPEEHK